jgi:hypothetical protein
MAKTRTAHAYELELRKMIKHRTAADMEPWLLPQVRATAMNMVIIDKIQAELMKEKSFITIIDGSMGQKKNEVNPLLSHYDKAQRTFMSQLEALGLNYSARQNKNGKNQKDDEDPLANALNEIKGI